MVARSEQHKAVLNERVSKAQDRYGYLSQEFKSDATREGPERSEASKEKQPEKLELDLSKGPIPPGGFPRQKDHERASDDRENNRDNEQER